MNPIDLIGRGVGVATGAVRVATSVPRLALNLLIHRGGDSNGSDPFAAAAAAADTDDDQRVAPPSPGAAESTSAPGASGGVGGTAAAPTAAARAGAPDPTAATTAPAPDGSAGAALPQGERRANDVRPQPSRRKTVDTEETLVETEGAASPGPQIHVGAPFDGYDKLKAPEIVARVKEADESTKAVVRLYESTHKKRKSILDATAS